MNFKSISKLIPAAIFCFTSCGNPEAATEMQSNEDTTYQQGPIESQGMIDGSFLSVYADTSDSKSMLTQDVINVEEAVNDLMGRGYDSYFDKNRERVFENKVKAIPEIKTIMEGIHINKSSDYYRLVKKKASGSVSGYLGSASAGASSKYSIKTNTDEEIFAATVTVQKARYVMDKYRLTKDAKTILTESPDKFQSFFGSAAITEVVTGAECWLVFKLKAKTSEELTTLRQRASASSGIFDGSASASFSNKIREIRSSSVEDYSIIVNGVDEIPKDNIDSAIAYFFRFKEIADKSSKDVILSAKPANYIKIPMLNKYNIDKLINYKEIDEMKAAMSGAMNMIIEAQGWLTDIDFVLNSRNRRLYDNTVKAKATSDRIVALDMISKLENFIDDIKEREQLKDLKLLDSYSFNREFYPQKNKQSKPPKRVTSREDGNIAGGTH